jgi:hypothetical protein
MTQEQTIELISDTKTLVLTITAYHKKWTKQYGAELADYLTEEQNKDLDEFMKDHPIPML